MSLVQFQVEISTASKTATGNMMILWFGENTVVKL